MSLQPLLVKVLPSYIAADINQNMSIWNVAKLGIVNSKYVNQFKIISPPTANPLKDPLLNIIYLQDANLNITNSSAKNTNININWNIATAINYNVYAKAAIKELQNLKPNLVEVENDYRLAGIIAKKIPKSKVILIAHTIFAKRSFFTRIVQYFKYLKPIHGFIFVSNAHANYFKDKFPYSFKKTNVIYNSYAHIPNNTLEISQINYKSKLNQIIFAGRATKDKGYQEYLLAVLHVLLQDKYKKWQAKAVLSVEYTNIQNEVDAFIDIHPDLQNLINRKQLNITTNLPSTQLFEEFKKSKIAVFPTHQSFIEGMPLVGLEAHAAKCTIIAANNQGFVELSQNNAVFLKNNNPPNPLEIASKIETLIDNPNYAETLASNGQKHIISHNNINTLIQEYDKIRAQLLQNSNSI